VASIRDANLPLPFSHRMGKRLSCSLAHAVVRERLRLVDTKADLIFALVPAPTCWLTVIAGSWPAGGLTPQQEQYLHAFIARYNERTKESKRLTQAYRQVLADPRAVSGFRAQWKEIVYPIVTVRSKGSAATQRR
jgi:hypothetical protein